MSMDRKKTNQEGEKERKVEIVDGFKDAIDDKVEKKADEIDRSRVLLPEEQNDRTMSELFVGLIKSRFRYIPTWDKWIFYDGVKWNLEVGEIALGEYACMFAKEQFKRMGNAGGLKDRERAELFKFIQKSNNRAAIDSVMKLARFDKRIRLDHKELDAKPKVINCLNVTVDLETGDPHKHHPEDYLTQVCSVNYDETAKCPLWIDSLKIYFAKDQELIDYIQTFLGYSISGLTGEEQMHFWFGGGNNGKSVCWNTIKAIMGDYACVVSQDLILPKRDAHPTEFATLFGKRMAFVSEPDEGRVISDGKLKGITGGDEIQARRMREDFWSFLPTHKFFCSTNHLPRVESTDDGTWRRLKCVPFKVDLSTVDGLEVNPDFKDSLKKEWEGIFAWLVRGWGMYAENGLTDPKAVTDATAQFKVAEDEIATFIDEELIEKETLEIRASDLYQYYKERGGKMSAKKFGTEISKHFKKDKRSKGIHRHKVVYEGVGYDVQLHQISDADNKDSGDGNSIF
ncbi:phage/plasmid primase, P4 family [Mariniblastus sp.]|nr:phage/plasmid primase, P4 family [Mariniblastus sp.]